MRVRAIMHDSPRATMTRVPRRVRRAWMCACILAFAALVDPLPLHAQLGPAFIIPSDGVEFFALLADRANLGAVRRMSDLAGLDPARTLIVVLGDNHVLSGLDREVGGLTKFLERGGALLVATDRPDEGRLRPFGLSVSGATVEQAVKSAYLGNQEC